MAPQISMHSLQHIHRRPRHAFAIPIALVLISLYLPLLPKLAHASDADSIAPEDHNHYRISQLQSEVYGTLVDDQKLEVNTYEAEFIGADRGIIGRAEPSKKKLVNNTPGNDTLKYGETRYWTFSKAQLSSKSSRASAAPFSLAERDENELVYTLDVLENGPIQPRQEKPRTLYITLNMCSQPQPKDANPTGRIAPLQLYISTDPQNDEPGQMHNDYAVPVEYGFGAQNLSVGSSNVYFAVTAPSKNSQFDGSFTYELTASLDEPYTSFVGDSTGLVLVDSDANAALFSTNGTVETTRYSIFVHPQNDVALWGLSGSYCALKKQARFIGNLGDESKGDVETRVMELRGLPLKQQFYKSDLNSSTAYYAILAADGHINSKGKRDGVAGRGGKVWKEVNFTTTDTDNCAVIYDLSFCTDVAYAVPVTPGNQTSLADLKELYDNDAFNKYQNFIKSLQQVACNTTSSAMYSLARNCTDCEKDYKTWLCAVTIPRCLDFSSERTYSVPRAVSTKYFNGSTPSAPELALYKNNMNDLYVNSSRNPMIDDKIKPGPYKEFLPCIDLCYEVVRSCPATLGFACPLDGHGLNYTYGINKTDTKDATCNYPGEPFHHSVATTVHGNLWFISPVLLVLFINLV